MRFAMRTLALRFAYAALLATLAACGDDDDGGSPARDRGGDATTDGGRGICTADGDCEEALEVGAALHQEGTIDYPDSPPAGGMHNPCWGDFGVHDDELPAENWVHNLEHGAVVFLHDCPDGCADELADLAALVEPRPFALLTPYPGLPTRFAVVAWGYRLQTDNLDLDAFEAFYDRHHDQAGESSSSGAPSGCP